MRRLVAPFALALGGCNVDAFGLGDGGVYDGGASASTTGGAPSETSGAPDPSHGTGQASGTSSGASADDTSSTTVDTGTSSTSSTEGSTTDASTGDPPVTLCPDDRAELAACYDFADVGRGTLWDGSGNDNHGTAAGVGVTIGPFGEAATFDAVGEIAVPDSTSLDIAGPLSLEAWVVVDAVPGTGRVGIIDKDGQYSLMIYASQGYRCSIAGVVFVPVVSLGTWTHLACVHDGATLHAYVDGTLQGTVPASTPIPTDNTFPMSIGDTSPDFLEPLDGAIGGVRVWSRALSPAEVCEAAGAACSD